jgi:predicted AAA+ superfamily ATPase
MKYFERELLAELKKWIERREILAIKGPRQSGKTTLLEMLREVLEKKVREENIISLTFEDLEEREKFETAPKEFINSFIKEGRYYFLLDEFHYVKNGGQRLKLLYDTLKNTKFVITGSSSLELRGETAGYLTGRLFSFELLPFNFYEFLNARDKRFARIYKERNSLVRNLFNGQDFLIKEDIFVDDLLKFLNEFIKFGGYPEVIKSEGEEEKLIVLKNIVNTYIDKDIVNFLNITDALKFKRILTLLASICGNMLRYEEICLNTSSYYKEVVRILDILQQTYVVDLLRPYHRNMVTELRKNPKVYFVDSGLRNYLINNFSDLEVRVDKGALAENFVLNRLKAVVGDKGIIHFWRTTAKAEVDFVIEMPDRLIPVEVKFASFKREKIPKSLFSFIRTYSPAIAVVVTKNFSGERRVDKTKVKFIPIVYF